MNRQQMLSILNTMSDDNLLQALSAVGVQGGSEMGGHEWMGGEDDGLTSWGMTDVKIAPPNKPALIDANKFVDREAQQMRFPQPMYAQLGQDNAEGLEDYIIGANQTMGV